MLMFYDEEVGASASDAEATPETPAPEAEEAV